ncbi:hypothetical protein M1P56_19665 [Streptomyces sp. HU2014]|uniref:hypothetical protein n=1 Tax=Streptomyces sp. HU2014 TaxID=2939414 RepID=UPI00200E45D2|nr:hypothetical protein [Streptomyces sp. HU2014]UQI46404.1 hypothetical protein M1P56_19665 [Streptomyces sp. HU2014]
MTWARHCRFPARRSRGQRDGYRPGTTHEFDLAASLTRGLEGPSGAWSFIEGFAAHWAGALERGDGWAEADSVELLEENSVRLPFPAYPTGEEGYEVRWFLGRDVLLREDGVALLARGRTAGDLDRLRDLIPGDRVDDCR